MHLLLWQAGVSVSHLYICKPYNVNYSMERVYLLGVVNSNINAERTSFPGDNESTYMSSVQSRCMLLTDTCNMKISEKVKNKNGFYYEFFNFRRNEHTVRASTLRTQSQSDCCYQS